MGVFIAQNCEINNITMLKTFFAFIKNESLKFIKETLKSRIQMSKEKNNLDDSYSRPRWIKIEKIRADINERGDKNKKLR